MKYTRVKAVTCALTASVIIFGSAAHTNASGVSYDLPAAGVGLVLDEGSSLSSVQEEASQSEQAQEPVQEADEAPAVTSEDIEAGATGVGEAVIDTEVVSHIQEQQVEKAIDHGVGVASVLNSGTENAASETESAPAGSDTQVPLTAGLEAAVNAIPSQTVSKGIEEPVALEAVQTAADSASEGQTQAGQPETEQTGEKNTQETGSQQAAVTASEQDRAEEQKESEQESASETESRKESQTQTESSEEKTSSESETESSGQETSAESEQESSAETSTETEQESSAESETESAAQTSSSENGTTASTQETETVTETESTAQTAPSESQTEAAVAETPSQSETESTTETASAESAAEESEAADTETESAAVQTASESETISGSETAETAAQTESVQAASAAASHTEVSSSGSSVAEFALQFVGNPYVYGGTSLTNGADCSGFVMSVYENFDVSLPHSSSADRSVGTEVAGGLSNAQPGDIVCYSGHVGIYIGNGQIVHASTEETGIKVSDADYRTPITVRRIFS